MSEVSRHEARARLGDHLTHVRKLRIGIVNHAIFYRVGNAHSSLNNARSSTKFRFSFVFANIRPTGLLVRKSRLLFASTPHAS